MPSRIRQFLSVIAVLAVGFLVFFVLLKTKPTVATVESTRAIPLVSALPFHAESAQVAIEAWGSLAAIRRFPIKTRVAGEVTWLHPAFDRGGVVKKDELIARIDPKDYQLRLDNARAQLALRETSLQRVIQEEKNLNASHAIEEKNYALALKELTRFEELLRRKTVSRQAYDNVVLASQKSRTLLQNLENQLAITHIMLDQENANLKLARIAVEQADLDLSRTEIHSPISGRFADRQVDLQQYLAPGSPLGTIIDMEHLQVAVDVAVKDFYWLFPNGLSDQILQATAAVTLADSPDTQTFTGRITRTGESLDPATRTLSVFVELDQVFNSLDSSTLLPGRFCKVSFKGSSSAQAFRIPFVAMNGGQIQIVRGGQLVVLPAVVIRNQGDELLIQGSFNTEDQLVAVWNETLTDGDKVQSSFEEVPIR